MNIRIFCSKAAIFAMSFVLLNHPTGAWADFVTATITTGSEARSSAVNPVTNKIYVTNYGTNTVTEYYAIVNIVGVYRNIGDELQRIVGVCRFGAVDGVPLAGLFFLFAKGSILVIGRLQHAAV